VKIISLAIICFVLSSCNHTNKSEKMSLNKQTVRAYMEAFQRKDHQAILDCVTEDVIWVLPGVYRHEGKAAFEKEIDNEGFSGKPTIAVTRLTEENNIVVAEGKVKAQTSDGKVVYLAFSDVFEMRSGLIQKLTSYLMQVSGTDQF
jgi:ketosteroid isomerase-like protein